MEFIWTLSRTWLFISADFISFLFCTGSHLILFLITIFCWFYWVLYVIYCCYKRSVLPLAIANTIIFTKTMTRQWKEKQGQGKVFFAVSLGVWSLNKTSLIMSYDRFSTSCWCWYLVGNTPAAQISRFRVHTPTWKNNRWVEKKIMKNWNPFLKNLTDTKVNFWKVKHFI